MDESGQRDLAEIVKRVYRVCDTIANGDPEAVTAYVARFMTRLLRTITAETQIQTRAATPTLGANMDAVTLQPTWLTDMVSLTPITTRPVLYRLNGCQERVHPLYRARYCRSMGSCR